MPQEKNSGQIVYRVQFKTDDHHYDLYVRHVYPAEMGGFICLEQFIFQEENQLIINPRNEKLAKEFAEVETAFIPYYQIIRIDQVRRIGESRVSHKPETGSKIRLFPNTPV